MAKLTLKKVMVAFVDLETPRVPKSGGKPKYGVAVILQKGQEALFKECKKAAVDALVEGAGAELAKKLIKKDATFTFNTDSEHFAQYGFPEDTICCFNAKTTNKPGVVNLVPDQKNAGKPTEIDPSDVFSGCIVNLTVNPKYYDVEGKKGVTFYLGNVQLVDDSGPRLDGRGRATDEFEADASFEASINALDEDGDEDSDDDSDDGDDLSDLVGD